MESRDVALLQPRVSPQRCSTFDRRLAVYAGVFVPVQKLLDKSARVPCPGVACRMETGALW